MRLHTESIDHFACRLISCLSVTVSLSMLSYRNKKDKKIKTQQMTSVSLTQSQQQQHQHQQHHTSSKSNNGQYDNKHIIRLSGQAVGKYLTFALGNLTGKLLSDRFL